MKNCKQIEYNDRLTPELLVTKPETDGYLAIFMFKKVEEHETCTDLIKHIYQFNSNLNKWSPLFILVEHSNLWYFHKRLFN